MFYGDRGDASRKQVRSAAAQHSHRIGPRKPKASKRPRNDTPPSTTRPLKANTIISLGPADIESRAARNKPHSSSRPSSANARAAFAPTPPTPTKLATSSNASTPSHRDEETKRRQAPHLRWKQVRGVRAIQQGQHPQPTSEVPYSNSPVAPTPQSIQAPSTASTGKSLRESSATSSVSPSTRLPQYSWTEYPRYGMSFSGLQTSLQMLAQVAVAEQEASDQTPTPTSAVPSTGSASSPALLVPGFRQYATGSEPKATESHEPTEPALGYHPPESSFGAFLQRAANGQGHLDDPFQRRPSSGSEGHEGEIKREAPPGG